MTSVGERHLRPVDRPQAERLGRVVQPVEPGAVVASAGRLADGQVGAVGGALRAQERIPWFDGGKLDDIVDYAAYVFVPALIVWRAILVPDAWTLPVAAASAEDAVMRTTPRS